MFLSKVARSIQRIHITKTSGINLSFNSYQNRKPCNIALNQSSLATARKTFLDSKGAVLFYVNIEADGMFNSFTKQEQEELLHWNMF